MREIVLDTETTGFDPLNGHRVVEIGAVELLDHAPTGRTFHRYINPERTLPAGCCRGARVDCRVSRGQAAV
jgi:DNA polymerase III subunit epsilon